MSYQRRTNVQTTLYYVETLFHDTNVLLTLCSLENLTSDFVSFSTSYQSYFNVDPTLKCRVGEREKKRLVKYIKKLKHYQHFSYFQKVS